MMKTPQIHRMAILHQTLLAKTVALSTMVLVVAKIGRIAVSSTNARNISGVTYVLSGFQWQIAHQHDELYGVGF